VATLRNRRSTPAEVRRAGQYQQLAARRLATGSSAFSRAVLARSGHETSAIFTGDVRAARSLIELTAPQKRLPRWRIISPPPVDELRRYYAEAQRLTGVHWTFLAAINLVETRMGRIRGTSPAGAQGPMQFMPSTWETYGAGGDINDPRDAILGAARLLRANGAAKDMSAALYRYNPSHQYVRAITQYALTMQRAPYTLRGYWHWRVLYRDVQGMYLLPVGYPHVPPVLLESR
jgi:membrane-bound lytic murein transglycosylase B